MEIRDVLGLLWRRRAIVVAVLLLTVAAAAAWVITTDKRYRSTATIAIVPKVHPSNGFYVRPEDISSLLSTFAVQARSKSNLTRAQTLLGRPVPGKVDTAVEGGSGVLKIIGDAPTAEAAYTTANSVARAFVTGQSSSNFIRAALVNPPAVPAGPYKPKPALIIGIAAALGLAGGALLAAAVEHLRRRVGTPADVAEITDAPVIARLPRERQVARASALEAWRNGSFGALQEGIRGLRTNLQFLIEELDEPILVTSSRPRQGKSTVVANLGVALAQMGARTLIIDADLRNPVQHRIFDIDNSKGLYTLLSSSDPRTALEEAQPRQALPNLAVLPAGVPGTDSADVLPIRLPAVLGALRRDEQLILIDSPPVLAVSDARAMAAYVSNVVLVANARDERPSTLRAALETLRLIDARLIGVVLNQVAHDDNLDVFYYYRATHPDATSVDS